MRILTLLISPAFSAIREDEMTKSQRGPVMTFLVAVVTIASSIAFGLPALAADCGGNVSACIRNSQGKPDNVAKCKAAGESCSRSGVFVGPFNGQSYKVGNEKGCSQYNRGAACY
jgi:hypothetical protein